MSEDARPVLLSSTAAASGTTARVGASAVGSASTVAATSAPAPAKGFLAHAKLIGSLTLVSRFAGLAREVVAGHYIGTGLVGSAFAVAFSIPNLFRKLFGEGALSAAFIPLYAQALSDNRNSADTDAKAFAAAAVNLLLAVLVAITLLGEAILAGSLYFVPPRPDLLLTLKLTMIMLPYVLLICGGAFLSGILQVHKRFAAPAAAPILLNVIHIAVVLIGARLLGLKLAANADQLVAAQTHLAYWLGVFVLVAGVLQVTILLPDLRRVGFRFGAVVHIWTPLVRRMVALTIPVAMGAGVLQLSVLLDKGISVILMQGQDAAHAAVTHFHLFGHMIRYPMELGAPARLNLAQMLYQFPLGIFAIALATAIFPALSADALDLDRQRFKRVLRQGIEASLWEGIPASVGLVIVCAPAVRLLFRHGQISSHDAVLITRSVCLYGAAIWAFSLQQILNRAYYAMHDTLTPLIMSIVTLAVNLAVELPLVWTSLGEAGMAAGTLASFSVQALIMLWMLDRRVGGLGLSEMLPRVTKMIVAAALMGAVCWAVQRLPFYPHGAQRIVWMCQLVILIGVGAVVYLGACAAMGIRMSAELPRRRRNGSNNGGSGDLAEA